MIKLGRLLKEMAYKNPTGKEKAVVGASSTDDMIMSQIELIKDLFQHLSPEGREFFIKVYNTSIGGGLKNPTSADGYHLLGMVHKINFNKTGEPLIVHAPGEKEYGSNVGVKNRVTGILQLLSDQTPYSNDLWDKDLEGEDLYKFSSLLNKLYHTKTISKPAFKNIFWYLTKSDAGAIRGYAFNKKRWQSNPLESSYRVEHTLPAIVIEKSIVDMIEKGEFNKENYKTLMDKSFLVNLNYLEDKLLDEAGFKSSMPEGWNWKTDSPWMRYQEAGIDPKTIIGPNGEHPQFIFKPEIRKKNLPTAQIKLSKKQNNINKPEVEKTNQPNKEKKQSISNKIPTQQEINDYWDSIIDNTKLKRGVLRQKAAEHFSIPNELNKNNGPLDTYAYFYVKSHSQNEEISRIQHLAGIKENDEEDFNVEAPPEWNINELVFEGSINSYGYYQSNPWGNPNPSSVLKEIYKDKVLRVLGGYLNDRDWYQPYAWEQVENDKGTDVSDIYISFSINFKGSIKESDLPLESQFDGEPDLTDLDIKKFKKFVNENLPWGWKFVTNIPEHCYEIISYDVSIGLLDEDNKAWEGGDFDEFELSQEEKRDFINAYLANPLEFEEGDQGEIYFEKLELR